MDRQSLYAMNIHYRYYDLEYFFKECNRVQFKNAELWLCPQHFYINSMWNESPDKLKRLMDKYQVKIVCICPEQNNPKPNNIAARSGILIENTEKFLKRVINLANEIRCKMILITPGWNYYDESVDEARERSARMIRKLCDYASEYEINLVMESIWNKSTDIANTKEKIKLLKDMIDRSNLKLTVDLGALRDVGESVNEWFDMFKGDVMHCHFTDGTPTGHMPWGLGECNMQEVLGEFQRNDYQGGFSMEYVDPRSFKSPELWDKSTLEQFEKCIKQMGE